MSKNPRRISLIGSRVTSVISVALVLIVVGLCATLGIAVHRASQSVGDDTTVMLTLVPGTDNLRANELKRQFKDAAWASRFEYTDAKTVLRREVETMDTVTRAGLDLLADNPFGDEFIIYVAPGWRNADSIKVVTQRLEALDDVDIVVGDSAAMGKANEGLERILIYLSILALVLLVISIVLINNTISLAIYSRRFNIHTMKLVGATNNFIRRPFVRAGMVTGIVAGLVAAIGVCGLQSFLLFNDNLVGPWLTPDFIGITAIALVLLGAIIARAAAWCAATNYLNKSYDTLFKK